MYGHCHVIGLAGHEVNHITSPGVDIDGVDLIFPLVDNIPHLLCGVVAMYSDTCQADGGQLDSLSTFRCQVKLGPSHVAAGLTICVRGHVAGYIGL